MTEVIKPLSATERRDLERCEEIIARGVGTFVEVGEALAQVRDARLYRETHGTFEKYVRDRWDMARQAAYRMIDGSAVSRSLSPKGDIDPLPVPRTERQARPLAELTSQPDKLREAWTRVVTEHGPDAPARVVQAVVNEVVQPDPAERKRALFYKELARMLTAMDELITRFERLDKAGLRRNAAPLLGYSNDLQHYINRLEIVRQNLLHYVRKEA